MLVDQLANAIVLGSIFTLFALGLSLSWGALDVLNLAHGAIFVMSAWLAGEVAKVHPMPLVVIVLVGMAVGACLAVLLDLTAFRPIRRLVKNKRQAELSMVAATVGAGFVLDSIVGKATLDQVFSLPSSVFEIRVYDLGVVAITNIQVIIVFASLIIAAAMHWWISASRHGMAIRAVAYSPRIPSLLGINVNLVSAGTMAVSGALAGLAGVLLQIWVSGMAVSTGHAYLLKAFAIVTLGGVGSVKGCLLAAFLLAAAETAIVAYGPSGFRDGVAFGLILLVLLIRPQGLFGQPRSARA